MIICFLLAVIAGFFVWILETWDNVEEFPRPFLIGWFNGFWWGFISMTTVGYGDKTPRSISARLCSVVWILIGIAIFGIISASLTEILIRADSPSASPTVYGVNVSVLQFHDYEEFYLATRGGIKTPTGKHISNLTADFLDLISKLQDKGSDGILLDKYIFSYFITYCKENVHKMTGKSQTDVKFFLEDTIRAEIVYNGEGMSYGFLVNQRNVFEYFGTAMNDNRLSLNVKFAQMWNTIDEDVDKTFLFEPSSPHFLSTIKAIVVLFGAICLFGIFYELKRTRCGSFNIPTQRCVDRVDPIREVAYIVSEQ